MDALTIAITITITGLFNVLSFYIGAKIGQAVSKGEKIELPVIDPMKAYREKQEQKELDAEKNKVLAILENVDNYDGTAYGQKDVPRG